MNKDVDTLKEDNRDLAATVAANIASHISNRNADRTLDNTAEKPSRLAESLDRVDQRTWGNQFVDAVKNQNPGDYQAERPENKFSWSPEPASTAGGNSWRDFYNSQMHR